jgi:hypothetical protein
VSRRAIAACCAAALLLASCGGGDGEPAADAERALPRSDRLVDFTKKPPFINGLSVEPGTKDFLLTTNRGFWRISPDGKRVARVKGTITAGSKSSPVGTFLEVEASGPGRFVGSGHPDREGALPSFLGLIASDDAGKTWRVISRLGDADLHKIVLRHDRLYAFDAVLSAMLISRDGGKTFDEQFTPRGLIIDFDVDPSKPDRIVASTEEELFRTEDGGRSWRPLQAGKGIRLDWAAPDRLYRAEKDGAVKVSADGGTTWKDAGRVPGEPYKLDAVSAQEVFLALSDGTIMRTTDGSKTWDTAFRP